MITGEEQPFVDMRQLPVQAFPNPFSEAVNIRFVLEESAEVKLEVRDLMGRKVWETNAGTMYAGETTLQWDGQKYRRK